MEELNYFETGWRHIIGKDALDHQLFILVLASLYTLRDWKPVLVLVTAFTLGHSLTLALSTLGYIPISSAWVEFLIPCTIVITALANFFQKDLNPKRIRINYFFALFFGLIHGLGFANTISMMLASDQSLWWPLLQFNLGLEAGQIVLVICILALAYLFIHRLRLPRRTWVYLLSAAGFIVALKIAIERFQEL